MKTVAALIMALTSRMWTVTPDVAPGRQISEVPRESVGLHGAITAAESGDTLMLRKGIHQAVPAIYEEGICGNCETALKKVTATVGYRVAGKSLVLVGEERDSTVILTQAGYGILFEDSRNSYIGNLTISGGVRDPDGNATDAAIVAKRSRVTVEKVRILENRSRVDTVVVGIGGVFGREGAELLVHDNVIAGNGWDGIALYRGATAIISNNLIDDGRGAGIGVTWDAAAIVLGNRISRYWKGIGAFGESRVIVRNNVVLDNLGWGIIATDESYMEVVNNLIYHNGNCGFAVWEETAAGVLKNNLIVENGWREEWVCPGVGVWMNGATADQFPLTYNNVWGNAAGEYEGIADQSGLNGNISADPLVVADGTLRFIPGSPCIDAGDPGVIDPDGSRSDIGPFGGPFAGTGRAGRQSPPQQSPE